MDGLKTTAEERRWVNSLTDLDPGYDEFQEKLADDLDTALARIAELEKDLVFARHEHDEQWKRAHEPWKVQSDRADKAETELTRLRGLMSKARDALEVFKDDLDGWPDRISDDRLLDGHSSSVTISDLRTAARVHAELVGALGETDDKGGAAGPVARR